MSNHNCRVCGLYLDTPPWGEDGKSPTYEICPCCSVEFGNEDYTVESTKRYREKWLFEGARWLNPNKKPGKWDQYEQFKNIPEDFL